MTSALRGPSDAPAATPSDDPRTIIGRVWLGPSEPPSERWTRVGSAEAFIAIAGTFVAYAEESPDPILLDFEVGGEPGMVAEVRRWMWEGEGR